MSRNAISANPEHYSFKIFGGSMPPDPLEGLKKHFSGRRVAQKGFSTIDFSPKQTILDRTLFGMGYLENFFWPEFPFKISHHWAVLVHQMLNHNMSNMLQFSFSETPSILIQHVNSMTGP